MTILSYAQILDANVHESQITVKASVLFSHRVGEIITIIITVDSRFQSRKSERR